MPRSNFGGSDWPASSSEPPGWRELQERARSTRDPRELEQIIDEMNRLLSECEKKAGRGAAHPVFRRRSARHPSVGE